MKKTSKLETTTNDANKKASETQDMINTLASIFGEKNVVVVDDDKVVVSDQASNQVNDQASNQANDQANSTNSIKTIKVAKNNEVSKMKTTKTTKTKVAKTRVAKSKAKSGYSVIFGDSDAFAKIESLISQATQKTTIAGKLRDVAPLLGGGVYRARRSVEAYDLINAYCDNRLSAKDLMAKGLLVVEIAGDQIVSKRGRVIAKRAFVVSESNLGIVISQIDTFGDDKTGYLKTITGWSLIPDYKKISDFETKIRKGKKAKATKSPQIVLNLNG